MTTITYIGTNSSVETYCVMHYHLLTPQCIDLLPANILLICLIYRISRQGSWFQSGKCQCLWLNLLLFKFMVRVMDLTITILTNQDRISRTSIMKVEEFVSRSSSLPIREKIWFVMRKEAYSAGTNEPIWAMICSRAICRRYVDFPLWKTWRVCNTYGAIKDLYIQQNEALITCNGGVFNIFYAYEVTNT